MWEWLVWAEMYDLTVPTSLPSMSPSLPPSERLEDFGSTDRNYSMAEHML